MIYRKPVETSPPDIKGGPSSSHGREPRRGSPCWRGFPDLHQEDIPPGSALWSPPQFPSCQSELQDETYKGGSKRRPGAMNFLT